MIIDESEKALVSNQRELPTFQGHLVAIRIDRKYDESDKALIDNQQSRLPSRAILSSSGFTVG